MLIIHRMAQLGVMTQKRPEIWVSYPKPHEQSEDLGIISASVKNQRLWTATTRTDTADDLTLLAGVGSQLLYDPTKATSITEAAQLRAGMGDHVLFSKVSDVSHQENLFGFVAHVHNQKLYAHGVRAENLDETNMLVSFATGSHKLYEE